MSFSQRRIAGVFRAVIGCSVALFVLATGPVLATEPGLVWQTKVPAVESDYGTRHFRSVRQFDGSILALTASSTNVSPRIISPQGEVVGRSEIPSDPYLSWVAGDPWGGVTVHGRPCTGCDEDVLKFDTRTGLPRWPQVFRAEALVGATPAGDILVQSAGQLVLLDGYSGSPRWTRPLGAFPLGLSTSTIFGLRYPASGEEIVALAVEDGSERWSVPVPPLFDRLSDRWIHAADTGDVLFAAKTSDGFAVAAYRRDTGALLWGPTQLPRGSLPARPAWVEVEQGGDGSVAVGAEFATPGGGGLLRDVGIWKIDAGGTVTWGPIVTASPPGPNSNDGIDDLLVEEGGEVLFAGFRGADRYLSQPSTRGFVSRLGAEDGRVRWEIPRDASAFGYRFFDLLPDGPDAVDVVASGGYDTVPLRIYRFSRHDGAMLRDRLMVSGRKESSFVQVALQADEERVRIATVSAFGGGLLYRTDLVTSTGEAHSDPSHSHEGISGDIAAVATSGDIVVLRGGSSLAPMEITFMETALTARWRRQIGPLGGTNKSLVVSENEVFVSYASPTGTALVALSAATGETLWGPVFFEGSTSRLLALPNRDVVLVLSDGTSRRLLRVRKENGDVVWNRLSGPGAVAGLSDVDIAADAVGVALSYGSPTGKVLERRGIEDGELSFPPMAFPGQGKALLASQGGSTFLALVPEVQGGAATLRRIDGSGSVAWVRSQSLSELAVGYGKALAADSGHVYLLYEVFDSAFPPREVSGHFVALLRAADGDSSGPPIPVGPRGLWSLKIGPAGLLVYSAGVVSRIDDVLSFGPGDGVLEPVGCGGALDIDLNVRNAQGAVEFSWVSPEAERPPGVTLTNTGRLVGMPLRGGV
ncbi:MAG: PQQ-binding-like beta-propeller repeat protein, partial [Acidobacteria bacterium]|nr:PQQ-binding-like beta-propeller repeat protein [Acidobacteriota bacterium]